MNAHTFIDNYGNRWERVNRRQARKSYDDGKKIIIIPCKLDPSNPWHPYAMPSNKWGDSFDDTTNYYASINCTNETGRYLSYYVTEGPAISIRAPRFSYGSGAGYVTADTIEVTINGYRLKPGDWIAELDKLAYLINHNRGISRAMIHKIFDPVAAKLRERVTW